MPDLTCQFEASFQTPHMACNAVTGAGEKPLTHDAQSAKSLRIAPKRPEGQRYKIGAGHRSRWWAFMWREGSGQEDQTAASIFAMIALIIALIGMWAKFAPVAKSVTTAGVEPSTSQTSPVQLMSRSSKALPKQYYKGPF